MLYWSVGKLRHSNLFLIEKVIEIYCRVINVIVILDFFVTVRKLSTVFVRRVKESNDTMAGDYSGQGGGSGLPEIHKVTRSKCASLCPLKDWVHTIAKIIYLFLNL